MKEKNIESELEKIKNKIEEIDKKRYDITASEKETDLLPKKFYHISSDDLTLPPGNFVVEKYIEIGPAGGLTISPGTILFFNHDAGIRLNGNFTAIGTNSSEKNIVFTSKTHRWDKIAVSQSSKHKIHLEDCIITNSESQSTPYDHPGMPASPLSIERGQLYMNACEIHNNSGDIGGAISAGRANININNSTFYKNNSSGGGAIYLIESDINISNCLFKKNNGSLQGGAIFLFGASGKILNNKFEQNKSASGSAIYAYFMGNPRAQLEIEDNNFIENKSIDGPVIRYELPERLNEDTLHFLQKNFKTIDEYILNRNKFEKNSNKSIYVY